MLLENWHKLSLSQQMGNIGSEFHRVVVWHEKGDKDSMKNSAIRVLELIDLSVSDQKWKKRLSEILRLRELICDYCFGENIYHTSSDVLEKYFIPFVLRGREV